jgi:hypothetical protein
MNMSILSLRRILIASCTLVMLTSCSILGTDTPVSEDSSDSTGLVTDTVDSTEGSTDAVQAVSGEAEVELAAFVAAVNDAAADQDVNDALIDAVVLKLQSDGKINPTTWAVDTTPNSGAAFKFAPGTAAEVPYCLTYVGIDPSAAQDDVAAPPPSEVAPFVRASFTIGRC